MVDASLVEANASVKVSTARSPRTGRKQILRVSKTDPGATLVRRRGYKTRFYYKVHYSAEAISRVVTDCFVTTGKTHECTVIQPRLSYQLNTLALRIKSYLADKGYGHGPLYKFLQDHAVRAFVPLRDKKLGAGAKGFKYDRKRDRYLCRRGEWLLPYKPSVGFVRYRVVNKACTTCPFRDTCSGKGHHAHRMRWVYRSVYQDEFDEIKRRSRSRLFREKATLRWWAAEGLFGEAKTLQGMRRARYRGIWKVQSQAYMVATVQNLKRLVFFLTLPVNKISRQMSSWLFKILQLLAIRQISPRPVAY